MKEKHIELVSGASPLMAELFTGIPYYMIVDKEEKVKYENCGFPGNDTIREWLPREL